MTSILRNTTVLMGLALLANAAAPIAQEAGLSMDRSEAQAANIKRTRLKKRNNGLYKSVVRIETDSGESLPAEVEVGFTSADDSSATVESQTLSTPSKGTVLTSGEMLLYANADFAVAGRMLGAEALGVYSFAWMIALRWSSVNASCVQSSGGRGFASRE